jgi:hypothetical protein
VGAKSGSLAIFLPFFPEIFFLLYQFNFSAFGAFEDEYARLAAVLIYPVLNYERGGTGEEIVEGRIWGWADKLQMNLIWKSHVPLKFEFAAGDAEGANHT